MAMELADFRGDLRLSLQAQRDDLVKRINSSPDREAAALHRQLTAVLEKIDRLPGGEEVSSLDGRVAAVADELESRRRARAAGDGHTAG